MRCECCHHKEPLNGGWKKHGFVVFCSVACETYHGNMSCGCFSPGHTDLMVTPESLDECMAENPLDVVKEQSEDEGLWFISETAPEAYLQEALRRLHEAVEGKTSEQCARAVLD